MHRSALALTMSGCFSLNPAFHTGLIPYHRPIQHSWARMWSPHHRKQLKSRCWMSRFLVLLVASHGGWWVSICGLVLTGRDCRSPKHRSRLLALTFPKIWICLIQTLAISLFATQKFASKMAQIYLNFYENQLGYTTNSYISGTIDIQTYQPTFFTSLTVEFLG